MQSEVFFLAKLRFKDPQKDVPSRILFFVTQTDFENMFRYFTIDVGSLHITDVQVFVQALSTKRLIITTKEDLLSKKLKKNAL